MPSLTERAGWVTARARGHRALEHAPQLYCAYLRRRGVDAVVDEHTTIVIDGPPGTASDLARDAFLAANPDAIVASHLHSAAHVIEALRLGKPTVLTIREPVGAITSYVARGDVSGIGDALRAYEHLHRRLASKLDDVVIAQFERVTEAFDTVVDEVNARYGTRFVASAGELDATDAGTSARRVTDVRAALRAPEYRTRVWRCETLYAECLARATLR